MIVWTLDLQLPVQSVPITIKAVSSSSAYGEVYSIQHYVIKFINDLWQVESFLWVLRFPPPINWPPQYNWNIVESDVKYHIPLIHNVTSNSKIKCLQTEMVFVRTNVIMLSQLIYIFLTWLSRLFVYLYII